MVTVVTNSDRERALAALSSVTGDHEHQASMQRFLVHTMVRDLRSSGVTWREIGAAAGISHVAAMKRWKADPVRPDRVAEYLGDPEDLGDSAGAVT